MDILLSFFALLLNICHHKSKSYHINNIFQNKIKTLFISMKWFHFYHKVVEQHNLYLLSFISFLRFLLIFYILYFWSIFDYLCIYYCYHKFLLNFLYMNILFIIFCYFWIFYEFLFWKFNLKLIQIDEDWWRFIFNLHFNICHRLNDFIFHCFNRNHWFNQKTDFNDD
jgi:hypothetical protein